MRGPRPSIRLAAAAVLSTAIALAPRVARADYPLLRIDRPRTLPAGGVQVGLGLAATDELGTLASRSELIVAPIADLEARVAYAPVIAGERDFERPVVVSARHFTLRPGTRFRLATQVDVPVNTKGDAVTQVVVGIPSRLKLGTRFAVFAGDRLVRLDFATATYVTLTAPIDAGVQVSDRVFVQVGTTLVTAPIDAPTGGPARTTIADVTPVLATMYVSPDRRVDLGLQLGLGDAQHAEDTLIVGVTAAWRPTL